MSFQPMPLSRRAEPFNDPDWIFEIKWDGSVARVYREWPLPASLTQWERFQILPALNVALPLECRAKRAVLDVEIVSLDKKGNSQFRNLMFRRGEPRFYTFDLLSCDGEDLRYLPLSERKHKLHGAVLQQGKRLLYCDHVECQGESLFQLACKRDLESIAAKRKFDPYLPDNAN